MQELDDVNKDRPDAGGDCQVTSPLPESKAAVEIWKPKFTLDQRSKILHQLLLGMNMFETCDEEQLEDLLGIDVVMDRWVQVLLENLPPCPWTGIHTTLKTLNRFVVDVVRINYEELTADAVVLGEINAKGQVSGRVETPRGADAPSKEIPLEELLVFPTDNILKDNLDKYNTVLDCLSFFKNHLWFSWDEGPDEEDEEEDEMDVVRKKHSEKSVAFRYFKKKLEQKFWPCPSGPDRWIDRHLDNRFAAYADHVNRKNSVYFLLRKLSVQHEAEKNGLEWNEHELMVGGLPESLLDCWRATEKLKAIEREADILENPDLRAASNGIAVEDKRRERRDSSRPRVALVWSSGTIEEFVEFRKAAESLVKLHSDSSSCQVVVKPTFQAALDASLRGDTIVISRGTHGVLDWGELRFGGSVYGLDTQECIIEAECVDGVKPFSLVVEGGCTLGNLTVMPASAKQSHGILVREGYVKLESCQVNQFNIACKVMAGANLSIDRCSFSMGGTGLMVEKGAKVTAVTFDVFIHDHPFVCKDATGSGLDFTRVGTDFVEAHTTIVVSKEEKENDNLNPANVLQSAHIKKSSEITMRRQLGISIVTEFQED